MRREWKKKKMVKMKMMKKEPGQGRRVTVWWAFQTHKICKNLKKKDTQTSERGREKGLRAEEGMSDTATKHSWSMYFLVNRFRKKVQKWGSKKENLSCSCQLQSDESPSKPSERVPWKQSVTSALSLPPPHRVHLSASMWAVGEFERENWLGHNGPWGNQRGLIDERSERECDEGEEWDVERKRGRKRREGEVRPSSQGRRIKDLSYLIC